MRGTLLNTATVLVGATIGHFVGRGIPVDYQTIALSGLGLVTVGMGIKLFLGGKNILIVALAVSLGGILGLGMGLQAGLDSFAEWARITVGGQGHFTEAVITSSVLYCVGPMTLLGCIQDGLEKKIDLLALKSTMDGIAAIFLTATLGDGVFVSAAVVLVFQGLLTLLARPLRPLAEDGEYIGEASAAGGTMMIAIGLGLLEIKKLPVAAYLPAIFLAPVFVFLGRRLSRGRSGARIAPTEAHEAGAANV
jgi:uncharacterized membrane protein YqgA involved in biofilm formation